MDQWGHFWPQGHVCKLLLGRIVRWTNQTMLARHNFIGFLKRKEAKRTSLAQKMFGQQPTAIQKSFQQTQLEHFLSTQRIQSFLSGWHLVTTPVPLWLLWLSRVKRYRTPSKHPENVAIDYLKWFWPQAHSAILNRAIHPFVTLSMCCWFAASLKLQDLQVGPLPVDGFNLHSPKILPAFHLHRSLFCFT